jgi:predicted permease
MKSIIIDLKLARRMMRKNPFQTTVIIFVLALGIGANCAIFSYLNILLVKPLPYKETARLVSIFSRNEKYKNYMSLQTEQLPEIEKQNHVFEKMAYWSPQLFGALRNGRERVTLAIWQVSKDTLRGLDVKPTVGRVFLPEDYAPGGSLVVMLPYSLWQKEYGGSKDVLGKSLPVGKFSYTIAGVLPSGFCLPGLDCTAIANKSNMQQLIAPWRKENFMGGMIGFGGGKSLTSKSISNNLAWLKPGITPQQAQQEMSRIASGFRAQGMESARESSFYVNDLSGPAPKDLQGANESPLLLFLAIGLISIIICANVTNLLLAKALQREKEMAVRVVLGASRLRLIRQLLVESLLLGLLGGGAGILVAKWIYALIDFFGHNALDHAYRFNLDLTVLLYTLVLSLLTGVIFGLIPAWQVSRVHISNSLKESSSQISTSRSKRRLQKMLVFGEIAISMVLLVGAGLLVRSMIEIANVDYGIDTNNLITARLAFTEEEHIPAVEGKTDYYAHLLEHFEKLPGVTGVCLGEDSPLTFGTNLAGGAASVNGIELGPDATILGKPITPGYFNTLGAGLRRGREFTFADRLNAPLVAIINESMAERFWGTKDPIGSQIKIEAKHYTVVGVAPNIRESYARASIGNQMYYPLYQDALQTEYTLILKTGVKPESFIKNLKASLAAFDPRLTAVQITTLRQDLTAKIAEKQLSLLLANGMALLALVLSLSGLYASLSSFVTQHAREMGIRIAMGAEQRDILRMVLGQSLGLTAAGVGVGLAGSWAVTRLISHHLFHVTPTDPMTYAIVTIVFFVTVLAASYLPARRASRIDPIEVLRWE